MEICRADLCESKPLSHNLVITDLMVNDVFDGRFTWGTRLLQRGVFGVGGSIPPPATSLLCELGDKLRPNFLAVLLIEPLLVLIRFGEVYPRPFGRIDPHSHKMRMRRCPGLRLTSALKITIDDNRFTLCGRAA